MTAKKHPRFPIYCDIDGTIYSNKTGQPRKLNLRKDGYLQLSVGMSSFLAHRIVLESFQKTTKDRNKVNHKNGVKADNSVANLEWCTQRENIIHARDVLGIKYGVSGMQSPHSTFKESHQVILANLHARGFMIKEIVSIMGFCKPTILRHLNEITRI